MATGRGSRHAAPRRWRCWTDRFRCVLHGLWGAWSAPLFWGRVCHGQSIELLSKCHSNLSPFCSCHRAASQVDMGQVETLTVAGVGLTAAQAAQQLLLTGAHQSEVLHCVVVRLAFLGQRERMFRVSYSNQTSSYPLLSMMKLAPSGRYKYFTTSGKSSTR